MVLMSLVSFADEVFEESNPSFEKISLRLWQDNLISETLGAESNRLHIYGGEFYMSDDNIYLQDDDPEGAVIWATVAGSEFVSEGESYKLRLGGQYRGYDYRDADEDHEEYDLLSSLDLIFCESLSLNLHGKVNQNVSPLDDSGVQIANAQLQTLTNS